MMKVSILRLVTHTLTRKQQFFHFAHLIKKLCISTCAFINQQCY